MPTAQLTVEYDNGEVYESKPQEITGLGVLLVDTDNDTVPDLIREMHGASVRENVSCTHPDEFPSIEELIGADETEEE